MSSAQRSAATNGPARNGARSAAPTAVPTSTGTTAAGSVAGRAAPSQTRAALMPGGRRRRSRKARVLREVGLPLLEERVLPLLRLLRQVVEQRRVAGELLQPREAVGVGVEGGLQEAQRRRALLRHL